MNGNLTPAEPLTYVQAVALLPDRKQIHTFIQTGWTILAGDWERTDILALLRRTDRREVAGPDAPAGMAAWLPLTGEPLFIETRPAA